MAEYIYVEVVNEAGTDRSSNLSGYAGSPWMIRLSTGRFTINYDVAWNHSKEQLNFAFSFLKSDADPGYIYVNKTSLVTTELDNSENIDYIKSQIDNSTYGLSAIKILMDSYQAANQLDLTSIESKIDIVDSVVDSNYALSQNISGVVQNNYDELTNATYGLEQIKTAIDAITASVTDDIKGSGFVSADDSLKAISDRTIEINNKYGGYML